MFFALPLEKILITQSTKTGEQLNEKAYIFSFRRFFSVHQQ